MTPELHESINHILILSMALVVVYGIYLWVNRDEE